MRKKPDIGELDYQKHVQFAVSIIDGTIVIPQKPGIACFVNRGGALSAPRDLGLPSGIADFTVIVGPPLTPPDQSGFRVEIECKVLEPQSPEQLAWEVRMIELGVIYLLIRRNPKLDLQADLAEVQRRFVQAVYQKVNHGRSLSTKETWPLPGEGWAGIH